MYACVLYIRKRAPHGYRTSKGLEIGKNTYCGKIPMIYTKRENMKMATPIVDIYLSIIIYLSNMYLSNGKSQRPFGKS